MPEPNHGSPYALVTGASSGIGEEFARKLAHRRRNLVLVARSREKLEALARELRTWHQMLAEMIEQPVAQSELLAEHIREQWGILVEVMEADLSLPGAAGELNERLRERGLEIDLLVNNAGVGAQGKFWELSRERQASMIRLNIDALVELTHLLLPPMLAARRGAIINVSSTASFQPVPYITAYSATKAFVTSFSLGLAEELRPYGVRVVTLCPGGTDTNFFEANQYGKRNFPGGLQPGAEVVDAALQALERGGGLVVPRLMNKFLLFVQRFIPRSWPPKAGARMFRM